MTALGLITARSERAAGLVAPRSADPEVARRGLDRMRRFMAGLGNPQHRFPTVHVTGSKGKGTTTALAASILTAAGLRTGRYLSPHLLDWRERISADGIDIPHDDFERSITDAERAITEFEAAHPEVGRFNAFELVTAAAFLHFAAAGCDAAVIEVGFGGRFDSTNVLRASSGVITSIEAEHIDVLGPTLADVAWNKAGIIQPGQAVAVVRQPDEAMQVIATKAEATGARLLQSGSDWTMQEEPAGWRYRGLDRDLAGLDISFPGSHQAENAGAAITALLVHRELGPRMTEDAIRAGLASARLRGRFEVIERDGPVVLDVAHTPASIRALLATVRSRFPSRHVTLILGILSDKDVEAIAVEVVSAIERCIVTAPPSPRALPADALASAMRRQGIEPELQPNPTVAIERGFHERGADVVVIAGSFPLVAHALGLLRDA